MAEADKLELPRLINKMSTLNFEYKSEYLLDYEIYLPTYYVDLTPLGKRH